MKYQIGAISLIFMVGCSSGGGGGGSQSSAAQVVNGTNFDGTYIFDNIQCYDSTLTTLTNSATYTTPYTDTATLSGTSMTSVESIDGCAITASSTVNISSTTLDLTNRTINSVTNGSCTVTLTLNNPNITPTSGTATFTSGETLSNIFGATYIYIPATQALGLLTTYTDGHGGHCFDVYIKQ